jgi:hypothetical protein
MDSIELGQRSISFALQHRGLSEVEKFDADILHRSVSIADEEGITQGPI